MIQTKKRNQTNTKSFDQYNKIIKKVYNNSLNSL